MAAPPAAKEAAGAAGTGGNLGEGPKPSFAQILAKILVEEINESPVEGTRFCKEGDPTIGITASDESRGETFMEKHVIVLKFPLCGKTDNEDFVSMPTTVGVGLLKDAKTVSGRIDHEDKNELLAFDLSREEGSSSKTQVKRSFGHEVGMDMSKEFGEGFLSPVEGSLQLKNGQSGKKNVLDTPSNQGIASRSSSCKADNEEGKQEISVSNLEQVGVLIKGRNLNMGKIPEKAISLINEERRLKNEKINIDTWESVSEKGGSDSKLRPQALLIRDVEMGASSNGTRNSKRKSTAKSFPNTCIKDFRLSRRRSSRTKKRNNKYRD